MDLVQRGDEEFMGILLGVAGEFGGCTPGGGQKSDGSIRVGVFRVYLLLRKRRYSPSRLNWSKSAYLPQ